MMLFSIAAIIAFKILSNSSLTDTGFETARTDASTISEFLTKDGVPVDWNQGNVARIGFMSENRVDNQKVFLAMNFTNSSYEQVKSLFQTNNDFLVVFEKNETDLYEFNGFCSFGKKDLIEFNGSSSNSCPQVDFSSEIVDNLVKIERIVLLNSSAVRMSVYVWN
jgi:hypothetical protein